MGTAVRCRLAAIDSTRPLRHPTLTKRNGRGKQNRLSLPRLFPSFEIEQEQNSRSHGSPFHSLGTTKDFGASAPGPNPQKTGVPTRIGTAAFNLNGQSLG